MSLKKGWERQGHLLFRWRGYLPLVLLPLFIVALQDSEYIEQVVGDKAENLYELFYVTLSFAGLAIRCITVGFVPGNTSGRNTKEQIAETLNTTGLYSIIRHPLYFGNFIVFVGFLLFVQVWWLVLVGILAFFLYYERIMFAEEEFLESRFGDEFLNWARETPAFLPKLTGFKKWKQPTLPFSFRTVLRREYSGFFTIIASFTFLDIMGDVLVERELELDSGWGVFFVIGLSMYLVLRTLKKRTNILHVKGR